MISFLLQNDLQCYCYINIYEVSWVQSFGVKVIRVELHIFFFMISDVCEMVEID